MPVLEVWKAKTRGRAQARHGRGYAGVDNPLFYTTNTRMLFGDARKSMEALLANVRK